MIGSIEVTLIEVEKPQGMGLIHMPTEEGTAGRRVRRRGIGCEADLNVFEVAVDILDDKPDGVVLDKTQVMEKRTTG